MVVAGLSRSPRPRAPRVCGSEIRMIRKRHPACSSSTARDRRESAPRDGRQECPPLQWIRTTIPVEQIGPSLRIRANSPRAFRGYSLRYGDVNACMPPMSCHQPTRSWTRAKVLKPAPRLPRDERFWPAARVGGGFSCGALRRARVAYVPRPQSARRTEVQSVPRWIGRRKGDQGDSEREDPCDIWP